MGASIKSIAEGKAAGKPAVSNITNHNAPNEVKKKGLRERFIPLLMLLLVIAITVVLFFYQDKVVELGNYGYLSAFLISLVTNASVILPVPGFLILFSLAATFNPVLVGIAGATGGVIGEITGYMAGYSGRAVIQNRRLYIRVEGWMKRWGVWAIFVFAVAPFLLFGIAGMVAGALRFPLWKFLLVAWAGKCLKYTGLLLAVAWGWEAILRYFN